MNLRELLSGDLNRLRFITRFSTALTLHKESVAEHSFYVILYAKFIADRVNLHFDQLYEAGIETHNYISINDVMTRALLHDIEECVTGDFPRPYKYRYPALREMLEDTAHKEAVRIVDRVIGDEIPGVNQAKVDAYKAKLTTAWALSKDETHVGRVVALADYLSVLSHLWQEVKNSNISMYEHYESIQEYLSTFEDPSYDFMRFLIEEVKELTYEIFYEYKKEKILRG